MRRSFGGRQRTRLGARLKGAAGFLPGTFTVGNMLSGYAAILMATQERFELSALLILLAGVLDGLDGRVARLTNTTSEFGGQLDSLCDAVSFAVAPSMLAFHMGVEQLGRAGWAACFLFAACGVIRLARFNASPSSHARYFVGLPIPAAAAAAICPTLFLDGATLVPITAALQAGLLVVLGLLMISAVRFRTFKEMRFGPRPYRALAFFAAVLAGLIAAHEWVIPGMILLYLGLPLVELARGRSAVADEAHALDSGEVNGEEEDDEDAEELDEASEEGPDEGQEGDDDTIRGARSRRA